MIFRTEQDSMGKLEVPENALWSAQTQRAVNNFPISGIKMHRQFIRALGLVKQASATINKDLNLLDEEIATAIIKSANEVAEGQYDDHFPVDIFQTGSGTSSNMNSNEVIANLANSYLKMDKVHPNDHVNMGQSSNDVIPTTIHVSCNLAIKDILLPGVITLLTTLEERAVELDNITKTGRTHLMDAMPITMGQEIGGWASQIKKNLKSIENCIPRLTNLGLGGTAVGTGINAHPEFGKRVAETLKDITDIPFKTNDNYFESLSCQDAIVQLSGTLRSLAVSLMKISNDLRWMNSGPLAGFAEIELPALQPGSSIMPGKVNPVIPEAICMLCAQVIGNDTTIAIAGSSGNFQLNVMLPLIAHNILQSIEILGNGSKLLANKVIKGFTVNEDNINSKISKNPILVTALNPVIGYELGAKIAKVAYNENRSVREVAEELTDLTTEDLDRLLDPTNLTRGGIQS